MRCLFESGSVDFRGSSFSPHKWHAGSYFPYQRWSPCPLQWEHRILTTELWGTSSDSDDEPTKKTGRLLGAILSARLADHGPSIASLLPEDMVMGSRVDENIRVCLPLVLTTFSLSLSKTSRTEFISRN